MLRMEDDVGRILSRKVAPLQLLDGIVLNRMRSPGLCGGRSESLGDDKET